MEEKNLICPSCKTTLETIKDPDIEYEKCPNCQGIFLDNGELNLLVTGAAGVVENRIVSDENDYNNLVCPKCENHMHRVQMSIVSEIYFDYCDNCEGYFLDKSKPTEINNYFASLAKDRLPEEFRGFVNNSLVRVDIEREMKGIEHAFFYYTLCITVYYSKSLNIDLHIAERSFFNKIARIFSRNSINGLNEIKTGNNDFDTCFDIHTNNILALKRIFNQDTADRIMDYIKQGFYIYHYPSSLSFYDDKIVYKEKPRAEMPLYRDNEDFREVIGELVRIAELIK